MTIKHFQPEHSENFEKMVGAAFLRLIGQKQAEVAASIGVGERTVRRWEARADWSKATKEAEARWLKDLDGRMMRVMEEKVAQLQEDLAAGNREAYSFLKWYAEHRWPEFAPPARRVQTEMLEKERYIVGAIPEGLIRR